MRFRNRLSLLLAAVLTISATSCGDGTDDPAAGPSPADPTATDQTTADATTAADGNNATTSKRTVCETITSDDLKSITGVDYTMANSTANFSNIKHCEYRSEDLKHVISVLIAFDATSQQRMEQNKLVPGVEPVADFEDEANWEPVRGTFTALSGNRCVEIQVSKEHGDDETRLERAQSIARLVLERY